MKWSTAAGLAVVFGCVTAPVLAQDYRIEGEATWWWEASIDGGSSWTASTLEVPQEQQVVRVRACVAFPVGPWNYFAGARIDQTVTGLAGAGMNDTITVVDRGFANQQTLVSQRFGNILKVDDISDTLPPGEGPGHWGIFNGGHATGPYTYANPLLGAIDFDLWLDGSTGDRVVSAWWRDWTSYFPDIPDMGPAILMLKRDLVDWDFIYPDLTVNDLTIRVVPAPGVFALLASACAFGGLRRRR